MQVPSSIRRRGLVSAVVLPLTIALLAFLFRLLSLAGFSNDHFVHLTPARQILLGEVPTRDFVDPGLLLTYYTSAAAMWFLGDSLWAEACLTIGCLSVAAAVTYWVALGLSNSVVLAATVAVAEIVLEPRLYNYPKLFLFAIGIVLLWWYVRHPTGRRLTALVGWTVVAALFRHDYGVLFGAACGVLIVGRHVAAGWHTAVKRLALFGTGVLLLLAPYLAFLHAYEGLAHYLETGIRYSQREADRSRLRDWPVFTAEPLTPVIALRPPEPLIFHVRWRPGLSATARAAAESRHGLQTIGLHEGTTWRYELPAPTLGRLWALQSDSEVDDTHGLTPRVLLGVSPVGRLQILPSILHRANAVAFLYYLFVAVPWVVLALVGVEWWGRAAGELSHVLLTSVAVLAIVMNAVFLRDPLVGRLADVAVPGLVLVAWVAGRGLPRGRESATAGLRRIAVAGGLTLVVLAAMATASFADDLQATGFFDGPRAVVGRAVQVTRDLRAPFAARQTPDARLVELEPVLRYVTSCTTEQDRLFVAWFAPEIPYYARRGFAAGLPFVTAGFYSGEHEQRLALERLRGQSVPIVLVELGEYRDYFTQDFARLDRYIRERYRAVGDVPARDWRVRVLVDTSLTPLGVHEPSGWPCFAPN